MQQAIRLLLLATILVACGTPSTSNTSPTAPTTTVATNAPPIPLPTTAPIPTNMPATAAPVQATNLPTDTLIITTDLASSVQQGYTTLVLLKGTAIMLEDTAQQVQAGKLQELDGFGRLIAIGAFLKVIGESLAKGAPDPALKAAWEQGQAVLPKLQDLLSQWVDKKITSKEVPGLVSAIQPELDQMLDTAETDLSTAYGTDPAKLKALRDKAMTDLQNTLQATPTPKP